MLTTTQHLSPSSRLTLLEPTLAQLFTVTDASGYIAAINHFVLKEMHRKKLSADDNIHLYNLLNLISSLSQLEKNIK